MQNEAYSINIVIKWMQIEYALASQINYIYILLVLGFLGAKLSAFYQDIVKVDANCAHFNIPNHLHLNFPCDKLSR